MTKFEKVREALEEATRDTNNYITIVEGARDARDPNGIKYHTKNVVTNNTFKPYETLKEVIEEYNLKIQ